jgi:short-subunit dehydrogenase
MLELMLEDFQIPNDFEGMARKVVNKCGTLMINVCAATSMKPHEALYLLPKMKNSVKGLIINVASLAALSPTPYAALYGTSKVILIIHNVYFV